MLTLAGAMAGDAEPEFRSGSAAFLCSGTGGWGGAAELARHTANPAACRARAVQASGLL